MNQLTFTVIDIDARDGYAVLWVAVGSDDPAIYVSGTVGIQVPQSVADANTVGAALVLSS